MSSIDSNAWVMKPQANPRALLRLFCLPHAGGGPQEYSTWPLGLPARIEVCAISLPGRGRRFHEPAHRQLAPLVRDLAAGLAPLLDRPFALFGHSMGALLAFELARTWRRQRQLEPVHLFVSGAPAPQFPDEHRFHQLPDDALLEAIRGLNGADQAVLDSAELVELLLPIMRADFEVAETYSCDDLGTLDCPLSVFGGSADQLVPTAQLDPWRIHSSGRCDVHVFVGDHFFLRPARRDLLALIAERLSAVM